MKKIFALILAISLVACMALSVSAANAPKDLADLDDSGESKTQTIEITLKDNSTQDVATVYHVDVAWANTNLTYTYASNTGLVWDPINHVYKVETNGDEEATGEWNTNEPIKATVTNHSNKAVTATLTGVDVMMGEMKNGVTFDCDTTTFTLASADKGDSLGAPTAAPEDTFEITVSGKPQGSFKIGFTIAIQ